MWQDHQMAGWHGYRPLFWKLLSFLRFLLQLHLFDLRSTNVIWQISIPASFSTDFTAAVSSSPEVTAPSLQWSSVVQNLRHRRLHPKSTGNDDEGSHPENEQVYGCYRNVNIYIYLKSQSIVPKWYDRVWFRFILDQRPILHLRQSSSLITSANVAQTSDSLQAYLIDCHNFPSAYSWTGRIKLWPSYAKIYVGSKPK